ncbi:serine/threonine specific protein phosphatase [Cyanobium sp. PCC 7001]|uniref:metallophosphoesterase n=1 Tax=Cyanobium sp. PCC 7001 TaxID=180281 RepID=UPI0001804DBA|nr:metallophosphoesterase [Cyanobium sp. PCC 7001]EDY37831.1 serine/threonine specific protein phosphatase [Cyanobium sp. PCC 7001]
MSSPSAPTRHWVIGDVHGCAQALEQLVDDLPARDRLVLCGDVINRGPQIERSMELAWSLVCSGRAVWLQGNHEADLVAALRRGDWQAEQTLAGCDTYRQLGDRRCRIWMERLASLPLTYAGDGWVATHAGFDPTTWEPSLTVRMPFWEAYDGRFGDVIVAHTPGHAVRRQARGKIVLIDTGACYGGLLSAYCPETGSSHSVPGVKPWFMSAGLITGTRGTLQQVCRS